MMLGEAACLRPIGQASQVLQCDPEPSDGEKRTRPHAASTWLGKVRQDALELAQSMELPNFRYGLTIRMDYSDLKMPEFVDAQRAAVRAPAGVVVLPLSAEHDLVKKWLFTLIHEKHRFAELHKAWADGWLIHVPKGVVCTEPIVIEHSAQSAYA